MIKLDRDLILAAIVTRRAIVNEKYGDALLSHDKERIAKTKAELDSITQFEELFDNTQLDNYDFYLDNSRVK